MRLVEGDNSAAFANPDSIQSPIQGIQGIEERFRLSLTAIAPKAFSHFVQGLNGPFDIGSRR